MSNYGATTHPEMISSPEMAHPEMLYPAERIAEPVVERAPLAQAIHDMFAEADALPAIEARGADDEHFGREMFADQAEAYQAVLHDVYDRLKESDAARHLRKVIDADDPELRASLRHEDVEAVFRAYERALEAAMHHHAKNLTAKQLNVMKFQARSELDWSLRDVITEHLMMESRGQSPRYAAEDFFLLLNPKARKIEYMSAPEILAVLRRSGSTTPRGTLSEDIKVLRRDADHLPAAQQVIDDPEFKNYSPETLH